MTRFLKMALILLVLALAGTAEAADWWNESGTGNSLDSRAVSRRGAMGSLDSAVRVNWVDKYIEVVAGGTADPREAINMAHALSIALKTARHLAYEKLAETVREIRINSDAAYDRELMRDSNLRTGVDAVIQGAKIIEETNTQLSDGSIWAQVRLGIHIIGPDSLMSGTLPWLERQAPSEAKPREESVAPVKPSSSEAAVSPTGLIIDAGGLDLRPAMAPKVLGEDGSMVYGFHEVDREHMVNFGLAGYARSIEQAKGCGRVGESPLVVRARKVGAIGCDLVVSNEDADRIRRQFSSSKALSECRVTIVVN